MPDEDMDDDGNVVLTGGMNYSDAEVLLEYYNSVVWFTQGDRELGLAGDEALPFILLN